MARSRSALIDQELKSDFKAKQKEQAAYAKVVLLGGSDSGKSTMLKQFKLIYGVGEIETYKRALFDNVFDVCLALMNAVNGSDKEYSGEAQEAAKRLLESDRDRGSAISTSELQDMTTIFTDTNSVAALKRRNEFTIPDNAPYFITNLGRICASGYFPTVEDMLYCRIMTTSISHNRLMIDRQGVEIVDVGGHRDFRFRWAPYLSDDLTCLFFIVSLSGYDQNLAEATSENRMKDAIQLWDTICKNKMLANVSTFVFLNKLDLFEVKIKTSPISKHFKEYIETNGPGQLENAIEFFKQKFVNPKQDEQPNRGWYCHITKATDTALMKVVLAGVMDAITRAIMVKTGLA